MDRRTTATRHLKAYYTVCPLAAANTAKIRGDVGETQEILQKHRIIKKRKKLYTNICNNDQR